MSTSKKSRAAKAQSRPTVRAAARSNGVDWAAVGAEGSIAHMLSESPGGIEGALERLRAAKAAGLQPSFAIAVGDEAVANDEPQCHPMERTDNRIRAYLASLRGISGVEHYHDDIAEAHMRGRALIERIASHARGYAVPCVNLSPSDCADVLALMASLVPIEPETWWDDTAEDLPSRVCGFHLLLQALEESLRAGSGQERSEAEASMAKICGTSAIPQPILDHLKEQKDHANELLSLLEQFDERDDAPMWSRIAVRTAAGLADALDDLVLGRVLKAAEAQS